MNLTRQIKHHVIAPRHTFFALTLPGFESVCRQELSQLTDTIHIEDTTRGGVVFSGRLSEMMQANLQLHTAGRILMRLDTFKATNFRQLVKNTKALRWPLYLPCGAIPECRVTSHHSRLYHSQAIAQRIRQAIADHWQSTDVEPGQSMEQTLFIRLKDDRVTLSLDSSGDNLYMRGLKRHHAVAPLRETLAAGILFHAGYRPGMTIMDPMCGGGTFSIEGALMAKQVAPGLQRDFAFMRWPGFKSKQWIHFKQKAIQKIKKLHQPLIHASDIDGQACAMLHQCLHENDLLDAVRVVNKDVFEVKPDKAACPRGLVVLNPPYGKRLEPHGRDNVNRFYQQLMEKLRRDFNGWLLALLIPKSKSNLAWPGSFHRQHLVHGGLNLTLITGKIL